MNKIEANISLFAITFFAAIQYIFLAYVPSDLSHFSFLCITNLIGFLITFAFFFGELFRLDLRQIIQSMILSAELIGFNFFMLMGVKEIEPAVTSAVLSAYFVFIFIFDAVIYRKKPSLMSFISVIFVLIGLFFMMDARIKSLFHINILYLVICNVFFAVYVMSVGSFAVSSNPSILAMGQMFFCFIFSLILWIGEAVFTAAPFKIPVNKEFWIGVIYISFFIRGLYGIIQIYAQRYISPLNTSLIFSTEIVMTMLISPLLASLFGTEVESITPLKIAGSVFIVLGLVLIEPGFLEILKKLSHLKIKVHKENTASKIISRKKIFIIILFALTYILADIPVRMTGFLPNYAGLKNSLPFILGLFYGLYGVIGCCIGSVISSLLLGTSSNEILLECWCIFVVGTCMHYGWHYQSKSHRINFKKLTHYTRYTILAGISSILCIKTDYMFSYFLTGMLIGFPVNILFGSLLYVEAIVPSWYKGFYDAEFELDSTRESLEKANEILELSAETKGINLKHVFEIQSCLEELSIRIFNAIPDAKIKIKIIYYNAISMRLEYAGEKYNPFRINKNEDILDIISLKIIKHRALRASFMYSDNKNKIHVVI